MKFYCTSISLFPLALFCLHLEAQDISNTSEISKNISALPVVLRENQGQWNDLVLFKGIAPNGASVSFMRNGLSFGFSRDKRLMESPQNARNIKLSNQECLVWNVLFDGADKNVNVIPAGKTESHANYFIADKTLINVPDYGQLCYKNLYKNIDLNYYPSGENVKYDYCVHKGGNVSAIKMNCDGIRSLQINPKGELEVETAWGIIAESKPYSYQIVNGEKKEVDVRFFIYDQTTYGFKVYGKYDASIDLVIDPIILAWTTYVDGSNNKTNGYQYDIALDANGNVYATGENNDSYPVTAGVYDNVYNGDGGNPLAVVGMGDVFVYKMNSTGTALQWATYVGGTGDEMGRGIEVNANGDVFVGGMTNSTNFPVSATAYKKIFSTLTQQTDAFVFKLTNNAATLSYSTYLGGDSGDEFLYDLALGNNGQAIVTGTTSSSNFPSTGGVYKTTNGGGDVFVTRLNAAGTGLVYSTFIGDGTGLAIEVDANQDVYVIGTCYSNSFPTTAGVFQPAFGGGALDAFVFKLSSNATTLIYSSFLGGSGNEFIAAGIGASYFSYGFGIAVNSKGEAFVTGATGSWNFPVTVGAYQTALKGGANYDVFVSRINPTATALMYSTYFGGNSVDVGFDIEVNSKDEAFVTGTTNGGSGTFPLTVCTYDSIYGDKINGGGGSDVFVAKFNPGGTKLMFSTYYGGSDFDYSDPSIELIDAGCSNEVVVGFTTHSYDLPKTTGAYKMNITNTLYANDHPTLFKLIPQSVTPTFTYTTPACNTPVTFTANVKCGLWDSLTYYWDFADGIKDTGLVVTHTFTNGGNYNVKLNIECPKDSVTNTVVVPSSFTYTTTATPVNCITANSGEAVITITGGSGSYSYTWSNGATTQTASNLTAADYTVTVTDGGACSSTAVVSVLQPPVLNAPLATITNATCNGYANGSAYLTPSGGASPYTYLWSNGSTSQTTSGLLAGTYTVTVNDAGACVNSTTVVISDPPAIVLTGSSTDAVCGQTNGTANVNSSGGTGALTYAWSNGGTSSTLGSLPPATYTITVTDANNCTTVTTVTVNNDNTFVASASPDQNICVGDTVQLFATGGTVYSWTNTATLSNGSISNPLAFPAKDTMYVVTISLGTCVGKDTVNVKVNSSPIVSAGADQSIFTGQSVTLNATGGTTYLWLPPTGLSTNVSANPIATPGSTTQYIVYVADANGCISSDTVMVIVDDSSCSGDGIFIPSAFSPNDDKQNDVLYIRGYCIKELYFAIFDRWGQKVFEATSIANGWDGTYHDKKMDTGVFVYNANMILYNGKTVEKKGNVTLIR